MGRNCDSHAEQSGIPDGFFSPVVDLVLAGEGSRAAVGKMGPENIDLLLTQRNNRAKKPDKLYVG